MTTSHTNRPDAFRARIVRGGYMTKVGGEAANCAPNMAGPVRTGFSARRQPLLSGVAALALGCFERGAFVAFGRSGASCR